jgi:hypothetical protein
VPKHGAKGKLTNFPYSPECVEEEFCELRLSPLLGSWVNKGGARSGATAEQLINEPQQQQWDADGDYFEKE